MKKLIMPMIIFAAFGGGWRLGQQKVETFAGDTWRTIPGSEKELYVLGFKHGYVRGFNDASTSDVMKYHDQKILASLTPAQKKQWETEAIETDKAGGPVTMSDKSALVLAAALSTLYADEQNASICWQQAMMLAAESLVGLEPSEEELAAARKKGVEEGCR